ncbi:hypothetical protein PG993_005495 [Apiospora rasikravindrae]|uniref:Ankyrin repeat protein n=1 Tax=Apiospora rasikravindrae TaxID=990691 RepID=A0ABR1THM0_9PEZI
MDLLEILENDLPAESLARMHQDHYDEMEKVLAQPLWWHSRDVGFVGCFAVPLPLSAFIVAVQRYKWDMNCLYLLVKYQDWEKIEALKEYKALFRHSEPLFNFWTPIPYCPLGYAIASGSLKISQACLELCESVDGVLSAPASNRHVPLTVALHHGALDVADLLLEWKADSHPFRLPAETATWK